MNESDIYSTSTVSHFGVFVVTCRPRNSNLHWFSLDLARTSVRKFVVGFLMLPTRSVPTLVKDLYLSKEFQPGITAALQELVVEEVLPSLQNIFVEELGPFRKTQALR